MRRAFLIAGCVLWAISAFGGSPKNTELQRQITEEFAGKSFTTKYLLGSYIYRRTDNGRDCYKPVDTEFADGKGILFQVRKGCYSENGELWGYEAFESNVYVAFPQLAHSIPAGTKVWVRKPEFKDNRIEFEVSTSPQRSDLNSYGKIKFMLGQGYQSKSRDELEQAFAKVLYIEVYEKSLQLQASYSTLKQQLSAAQAKYDAVQNDPIAKLQAAENVRDCVLALEANRKAYAATGHSEKESGQYAEQAAKMAPEIARLEEGAKAERVKNTQNQISAQDAELAKLQAQLKQKAPSTLAEWTARSEALNGYDAALSQRRGFYSVLAENGKPASSTEIATLDSEMEQASQLRRSLEQDKQRLELSEIDSQYRQMDHKRVQLEDSYVRAFGTAQEGSAKQAVLGHLEKMKANRLQAQQLGEAAAAAQMKKLETEISKFSRK